jgi:hypothetical protein
MNPGLKRLILFLAIVGLLACNLQGTSPGTTNNPAPIEPANTELSGELLVETLPIETATETPTILAPPPEQARVTPTATLTPIPTFTFTPTATEIPHLITLQQMNLRAGPGVVYVPVGGLPQGARANVIGRNQAADELLWWRIECPVGVTADQCWISGGHQFTQAINAENVPMVTAPPTPTFTPSHTPTLTPSFTPTWTPTPSHTPSRTPTPTRTPLPAQIGGPSQIVRLPTPMPTATPTGDLGIIPFENLGVSHVQMVACPVTTAMCANANPNPAHITLNSDNVCMFWIETGSPQGIVRIEVERNGVFQASREFTAVGQYSCRAARITQAAPGDYVTRVIYGDLAISRSWTAR